jgi:hypothetical protein
VIITLVFKKRQFFANLFGKNRRNIDPWNLKNNQVSKVKNCLTRPIAFPSNLLAVKWATNLTSGQQTLQRWMLKRE